MEASGYVFRGHLHFNKSGVIRTASGRGQKSLTVQMASFYVILRYSYGYLPSSRLGLRKNNLISTINYFCLRPLD